MLSCPQIEDRIFTVSFVSNKGQGLVSICLPRLFQIGSEPGWEGRVFIALSTSSNIWLTDMTLGEDNNSWRLVLLADAVLSVGHWCLTAIYSKLLAFVVMRLAFSVTWWAALSLTPHALFTLPADSVSDGFAHKGVALSRWSGLQAPGSHKPSSGLTPSKQKVGWLQQVQA